MKNKIFATLFLTLASVCGLCAQDFIVLKTGTEIKSKIVELSPTEIRYKEFSNPNGHTIILDKKHVFMIRYANGINEVVNVIGEQPKTAEIVMPSTQITKTVETTPPSVQNTEKGERATSTIQTTPKTEVSTTPSVQNAKTIETPTTLQVINNNTSIRVLTGNIFVGVALPLGSYANTDIMDDDKAAGAQTGFCAGLQFGAKFINNWSIVLEGQYISNTYKMIFKDVRNVYTLKGNWQHIQFSPVFRFEKPVSPNVSLYLLSGFGFSVTTVSDDFADVLELLDTKTKATSFVSSLGIGFVAQKNLEIGVRLNTLGPVFDDYKPSVLNLQATIGYHF
jgi:hypothetical protein